MFVGIGGANRHQVMGDEFMTHPTSYIMGTYARMMHSTELNAELGYNFNSVIKNKYLGIYPVVHVAFTHLFMSNHSMPN